MKNFEEITQNRQITDLQAEIDYLEFKITFLDHCLHSLSQRSVDKIKQGEIFFNLLMVKNPAIAKTIKGTLYDPSRSAVISTSVEKRVLGLWKRLPQYLDKRVV